ncbi:MAG: glycosyltransferase family 2 protein [Bacteroidetes bacterium]|nr:glycosyltransferase family 2 protein [Bacteroidota bacterium]
MIHGKKVVVVLPAYNAGNTLEKTCSEIPMDIVDELVLVDDASSDQTSKIAEKLGVQHIIRHEKNMGYGGNQKSCYLKALELNADIVVMLHPDYQYTPKLIGSMVNLIAAEVYPVVFGSRILGKGALRGGMPLYKYMANRMLTLIQNILMGQKLAEYHTGYRAFSSKVLKSIDFQKNSNDFVFDNEIIAQIFSSGYEIAEITCPTKYFEDASSINFKRSVKYGFGVLRVSFGYRLYKWGFYTPAFLKKRV